MPLGLPAPPPPDPIRSRSWRRIQRAETVGAGEPWWEPRSVDDRRERLAATIRALAGVQQLVGPEQGQGRPRGDDRASGGREVRVRLLVADDQNESCLVMQDVEGNEFCLD